MDEDIKEATVDPELGIFQRMELLRLATCVTGKLTGKKLVKTAKKLENYVSGH